MEIRRAAKSGRGPALFDLLPSDRSEQPRTPESKAVHGGDAATGNAAPSASLARTPAKVNEGGQWEPRPVEAGGPGERTIELDGERVRLSFTSMTAAAVLFVLLGLIASGFWLGHSMGFKKGIRRGFQEGQAAYGAAALDDIEAARRQPPATHLIGSLLEDSDAHPVGAALQADSTRKAGADSGWVRDHTYIVVQEFAAGREEDAKAAQEFVARNGIGTELVIFPSGAIQLITTQGFNRSDPTQRQLSDQLLRRLHEVGADYWAAGGGYKLEGYFKTLKNDSW